MIAFLISLVSVTIIACTAWVVRELRQLRREDDEEKRGE